MTGEGAVGLDDQARDPLAPAPVRDLARAVSVGAVGLGVVFLFAPATANDIWAWKLTPLTAGVFLLLSFDDRRSAWRLLLETFLVATALLLVGAICEWRKLDHANASTWIFVAGLVALALAILLLFRAMDAKPLPATAV
jgi:uncharacterized membrane protein HdeD (DUF308 family)